jgi:predicted Fe-S protein YdhL (DUF1289 family)
MNAQSPCIHFCRIEADGLCSGCFRTLAEIAGWATLSEAEKIQVLADLKKRKTSCPAPTNAA